MEKPGRSMFSANAQKYVRVFCYASMLWLVLGTLHLSALSFGEMQAGKSYDLSAVRWVHFLGSYLLWAFMTTYVYWRTERNTPNTKKWSWVLDFLATMAAWLVLISLAVQYLYAFLRGFEPGTVLEILGGVTPFLFLFNAVKFALTYGVCAGIVYSRRLQATQMELLKLERVTAEIMEKKVRFQLQALQVQLSPHFLFNALNSVSAMARNSDNNGVVNAIAYLADLLRYAVEATHQTEVLLDEELKFTANYIALQKIRFGQGFQYEIQVNVNDLYMRCPPFFIQTLVENVFSHNELSSAHPVNISVNLNQVDGRLVVDVVNSVSTPVENPGTGVGLRNLGERLELLYGAAATLTTRRSDDGFFAQIAFPIKATHE
jgi:two-component system LytT family sensor kinase